MDGFVLTEQAPQTKTSCLIVGHRSLQNDLLATLLTQRLGAQCAVASFDETLRMRNGKRALALIDQDSVDVTSIEAKLPFLCERADAIALFNAHPSASYAWILGQPEIRGLFYQNTSESQFLQGLRALFDNECWLPRKLLSDHLERTRRLGQRPSGQPIYLTDKEQAILRCLASGASNAEIARLLHNSPHTVKTHICHLFRKLKVSNRVQAASWAHHHPDIVEGCEQ